MLSQNIIYNESNLVTIQDKLSYLTIHESPDYKSKLVDKILLHDYSKKILGKDICVPILKIYNNSNDINLDELPDKFVLKCNHGSGMNIICNNKEYFDLNKAKIILNKWISENYGTIGYEFQYLNVEKKIFAETFLKDNIEDYLSISHSLPLNLGVNITKKFLSEKCEKYIIILVNNDKISINIFICL